MKSLFTILIFGLCLNTWAQKPKKYVALANESEKVNDYTGAAYYYKKAFELDSSSLDIYYKYATALFTDNNYKKAEFAFEYHYYHPEREESPEGLFFLALNQQYNGRYKQASKNFRDFQKFEGRKHNLYELAKQHEKSCEYALVNEEDPKYFEVTHLDRSINTIHSEFAPFLEPDSQITFAALKYAEYDYANRLPNEEDAQAIRIWNGEVSKKNSTILLDSLTQAKYWHWGNLTKFSDNEAYVTICGESKNCGIYAVEIKGDSIYNIKKLPEIVNQNQSINTHPRYLAFEKDTFLLFASNREGGFGGYDIWASRIKNKEYQKPENLGQRVNSQGNEITPFYYNDSNYLYFSSDWHEGYGGYDIFRVKGNLTDHTFPENAGTNLNSSANDLYFNYSPNKTYGTFVSNRKGSFSVRGETCCNDIYFFKHIVDEEEAIDLNELATKKDTSLVVQNANQKKLENPEEPPSKFIFLTFDVYFPNDYPKFSNNPKNSSQSYDALLKTYQNQKVDHQSLDSATYFFETLLPKSFEKLIALKAILQEETSEDTLYLNLRGFSSPLAGDNYNKNLSARRIDAILKYLEVPKNLNLKINIQPLGERENLPSYLSDRSDKRSIISLPAMKERKVAISLSSSPLENLQHY